MRSVAARVSNATVFDAALAVLAQRGYAGATTRSIASAAGVNEVTLFRRYGDKRGLVLAAIHADIGQFAQVGLEPTGDLERDLIRVVEYYSAVYRHRDGLVGTLILEATRDEEVAALIHEPLTALTRLGDLLAHYQRAGQLVDGPTDYAVQALLAPLLMSTVMRRIIPSQAVPPDAPTVVRRFLEGHRATTGS